MLCSVCYTVISLTLSLSHSLTHTQAHSFIHCFDILTYSLFLTWCAARGFIRRLLGDEHLFVTSPSYLLDNTYETPDQVMYVWCMLCVCVWSFIPFHTHVSCMCIDTYSVQHYMTPHTRKPYISFTLQPHYLMYGIFALSYRIHHMDLYRLPNSFDPSILGIPDIFSSSKCTVLIHCDL